MTLAFSNSNYMTPDESLFIAVTMAAERIYLKGNLSSPSGMQCASWIGANEVISRLDHMSNILVDLWQCASSELVSVISDGNSMVHVGSYMHGLKPYVLQALQSMDVETSVEPSETCVVLTTRELELLDLAEKGFVSHQIAEHLGISNRTVTTHFTNIYRKLGVGKLHQALAVTQRTKQRIDHRPGRTKRHTEDQLSGLNVGITLLALHGAIETRSQQIERQKVSLPQKLVRVATSGKVSCWDSSFLTKAVSIAVAPESSRVHGFCPGNVFILDCGGDKDFPGCDQIVEVTSDGGFVRQLQGGEQLSVRLLECTSLTFSNDGRLLVATGALGGAILSFVEGGDAVSIDYRGPVTAVVSGGICLTFALAPSKLSTEVIVLNNSTTDLVRLTLEPPGALYSDLCFFEDQSLYLRRVQMGQAWLDAYSISGEKLMSHRLSGMGSGRMAILKDGSMMMICPRSGDVRIVEVNGCIKRTVDFHGKIVPECACQLLSGDVLVGGTVVH